VQNHLDRVQAFADAAFAAGSIPQLHDLMENVAREFGADYFLMIHHADFSQRDARLIWVGNYPQEFIQISPQLGDPLDDPILEACEKTLTGFFWSEVGAIVPLTEKHHRRRAAVQETGLSDGFVVPTHIPGEHIGSCHFATDRGRCVPRANSAALQTIASFGFEAARRLVGVREGVQPGLTDRQRECLIMSAKGKSDTVIAQLLGLSPKTVNMYIEAAKKRYGVATRAQLIVSALYASEITFLDIAEPLRGRAASAAVH
jgi:LuxR family transcriptional regulator, quorum-sensing system regulator CciR